MTTRLVVFLGLVLAGVAGRTAESPATAASPEFAEFTSSKKNTDLRYWSPRFVYRDAATFRLDVPSALWDQFIESPPTQPAFGATISVHHLTTGQRSAVEFPLRDWATNNPHRELSFPSEAPAGGFAYVDVNLAGWPDGEVEATLAITASRGPVVEPRPQRFQIVRDIVAKLADDTRAEMLAWLDEANADHLIWGKRPLWPNLTRALAQPTEPYRDLRGFILRSYPNPQLDLHQPYTLYIPPVLDLTGPVPLLILLHGSGGDYRNLIADYAAGQRLDEHPMLIANAGAYGWTEFRHFALNDVRWIIEDVGRKYRVDPARIYLQGISLGGRGCLDLAAMMPDTFAAVSAHGVYGVQRELLDPVHALRLHPVTSALAARNDLRTWLPNLRQTAVEIVFGWKDESTRPVNALVFEQIFALHRIPTVLRGFDSGHDITLPAYDWATTREWFLKQKKDPAPTALTFRPTNLRHGRCAWLQVEELRDYHRVAEVQASISAAGQFSIKADNIARLRYHPPPAGHPQARQFPAEPLDLLIDTGGRLTVTNGLPRPTAPTKHARQGGPIWDVWSEPFTYVYDTAVPASDQTRLEAGALRSARSDATVRPLRFPVKADRDLTDVDRTNRNVIFFTTRTSTNTWRQRLTPLFPAIPALTNGSEASPVDIRIALRPSPWSANHYVLIIENDSRLPFGLHDLGFWQLAYQADWLLVSAGSHPGQVRIRAAGCYDHHWLPAGFTTEDFRTTPITR